MGIKEIRENKWFRFFSNKFVLITALFLVWMLFFDENSWLNHRELNEEIDKLEKSNDYYQEQISRDRREIKNLNHPDSLEKYAREQYNMKKEDEEIFLIEYDTLEE